MNSDKGLDVVELWSGVESIVFADRAARAASHQDHQHLQAEGFDKHRSLGITAWRGQGCEYSTCMEAFRHAPQLIYWLR